MTHAEAVERSRRERDHGSQCHRELVDLGPVDNDQTFRTWVCSACQVVIAIDGAGIIRDVLPLTPAIQRN